MAAIVSVVARLKLIVVVVVDPDTTVDTAVTVVPLAILEVDEEETVEPTSMLAAAEAERVVVVSDSEPELAASTAIITTVPAVMYVGASVGETVGAIEGEADGIGVGTAPVVEMVSAEPVVFSNAAILTTRVFVVTDTTIVFE